MEEVDVIIRLLVVLTLRAIWKLTINLNSVQLVLER